MRVARSVAKSEEFVLLHDFEQLSAFSVLVCLDILANIQIHFNRFFLSMKNI